MSTHLGRSSHDQPARRSGRDRAGPAPATPGESRRPCARRPGLAPARRHPPGFTLVEMLVATTIGAVLLVTAAYTAGAYSQAVATLQSDDFTEHEMAMARIMQDVRYAYWVQIPRPAAIEIGDHRDRVRSYHLDLDGNIVATHHDSTEGVICSGVASLAFEGLPIQRLREATPQSVDGIFLSVESTNPIDRTLAIGEGGQVAVPFMIGATYGEVDVTGVTEQVLDATPTSISLPLTAAVGYGSVRMEIFPARAPGDARPLPGAASLGSATVAIVALPLTSQKAGTSLADIFGVLQDMYGVTNRLDVGGLTITLPLITLGNLVTLIVNLNELILDEDYDPLAAEVVRQNAPFTASVATVGVNVAGRFAALQPGVAYTLVISVEGGKGVSVLANSVADATEDRVALKLTRAGSLTTQDVQVPFTMSGTRRITATTATDSLAVVHATLEPSSGAKLTKAAPVFCQALAADPWYGALPGESAP